MDLDLERRDFLSTERERLEAFLSTERDLERLEDLLSTEFDRERRRFLSTDGERDRREDLVSTDRDLERRLDFLSSDLDLDLRDFLDFFSRFGVFDLDRREDFLSPDLRRLRVRLVDLDRRLFECFFPFFFSSTSSLEGVGDFCRFPEDECRIFMFSSFSFVDSLFRRSLTLSCCSVFPFALSFSVSLLSSFRSLHLFSLS